MTPAHATPTSESATVPNHKLQQASNCKRHGALSESVDLAQNQIAGCAQALPKRVRLSGLVWVPLTSRPRYAT